MMGVEVRLVLNSMDVMVRFMLWSEFVSMGEVVVGAVLVLADVMMGVM